MRLAMDECLLRDPGQNVLLATCSFARSSPSISLKPQGTGCEFRWTTVIR